MENIEFDDLKDNDWFDDYAASHVETEPEKQNVPDGWFGKNEILNTWELHHIDVQWDLNDMNFFEDIDVVFPSEAWKHDGIETEGRFFFKEQIVDNLYGCSKLSNYFMYDFGDRKVLFRVDDVRDIYKRKNIITLVGWDVNVIIDLDDKKIETIYTR